MVQRLLFASSLLDAQNERNSAENDITTLLVVPLKRASNEIIKAKNDRPGRQQLAEKHKHSAASSSPSLPRSTVAAVFLFLKPHNCSFGFYLSEVYALWKMTQLSVEPAKPDPESYAPTTWPTPYYAGCVPLGATVNCKDGHRHLVTHFAHHTRMRK